MAQKPPRDQTRSAADWITDCGAGLAFAAARALPRAPRLRFAGALSRRVLGPVKFCERALENLEFVWPDLPPERARDIADGVLDNMGRTIIEIVGSASLLNRARNWQPTGAGLSALEAAKAEGRPVILVTGHFGNWEAARAALTHRGHSIGGLYRPLNNGYLDDRWSTLLAGLSGPVFARGRDGLKGFVRYLKTGGSGVILPDQYVGGAEVLDFLGRPAPTSLAAAELALRYDAPLIPFYGIRSENGVDFDIQIEAPIPPSDPKTMMQAFNDSLAAQIQARPEQWLWVHRRWKPGRLRRRGILPQT